MTPSPASPPAPKRWYQERPSDYPWEQDGLDHIKRLMPAAEPFRAWATFSFTAASGRIHECDLLIATPGGLYLVELKAHPGRRGQPRRHVDVSPSPRRAGSRTLRNPLHFTDLKSKDLKSGWSGRRSKLKLHKLRIPRVEPAVFLSDPGLRSRLDEVQQVRVYGRDDAAVGAAVDLAGPARQAAPARAPARHAGISPASCPALLTAIGVTASVAHLRFGDDWTLAPELLDAGPTWEDRSAERRDIVHETGRVRIYLTQQQASEEQRRAVERAARREYQVLQGITHRGIAQAVQIRDHHGSPAILFHHDPADLRLDSYLAVHGERLTREVRLDLRAPARRGRPLRPQPLALPPGARGPVGLRVGSARTGRTPCCG